MRNKLYICNCVVFIAAGCLFMVSCGGVNPSFNDAGYYHADDGCGASLCHGATALESYPPVSGKHTAHLASASGITCDDCHGDYMENPLHKDRTINGYDRINETDAPGDILFFNGENPSASWDNTAGTCSGMNCHGQAGWYTAGETGCLLCHGPGTANDPLALGGTGAAGKHAVHADGMGYTCETCHNDYKANPLHMNGTLEPAGTTGLIAFEDEDTATWDSATGTCASLSCHGSVSWYTTVESGCQLCHAPGYPNDPLALNGAGSDGKHAAHVTDAGYACDTCHDGYRDNPLHANGALDTDGTANIISFSGTGTWDNTQSTCAGLNCHGSVSWYTTEDPGCQLCHGTGTANDPLTLNGTGSAGKHGPHVGDRALACETCHNGYRDNTLHANGELNADDSSQIVFFADGDAAWNNTAGSCSSMNCHGDLTWYSAESPACTACHAPGTSIDPLPVGRHGVHLSTAHSLLGGMDCETCHNGYRYNAAHLDGTVDSSGLVTFSTTYPGTWNDASGTCESMDCHGNASWEGASGLTCTACHSSSYVAYYPNPMTSGDHSNHVLRPAACSECHYGYTGMATHINGSNDRENELANLLIFENPDDALIIWDDSTDSCGRSGLGCHDISAPGWNTKEWY